MITAITPVQEYKKSSPIGLLFVTPEGLEPSTH